MQQVSKCYSCGAPIAPGQHFCAYCGVAQSSRCAYCGGTLSATDKFCSYCGAPAGGGSIPLQPQGDVQQQPGWDLELLWSQMVTKIKSLSQVQLLAILLVALVISMGALVFWQFGPKSSSSGIPPMITTVAIKAQTKTTATIYWVTDKPSSSQIDYGRTPSYGTLVPLEPKDDIASGTSVGTTKHTILITGLQPGTTYHFKVMSADADGNVGMSAGNRTFRTKEKDAQYY